MAAAVGTSTSSGDGFSEVVDEVVKKEILATAAELQKADDAEEKNKERIFGEFFELYCDKGKDLSLVKPIL